MILLTSKYSEELIPISSHINGIMNSLIIALYAITSTTCIPQVSVIIFYDAGILDYLEGFHEDNLHKVLNLSKFFFQKHALFLHQLIYYCFPHCRSIKFSVI